MTEYALKRSDKIITASMRNYEIITKRLRTPKKKVEIIRNVVNEELCYLGRK